MRSAARVGPLLTEVKPERLPPAKRRTRLSLVVAVAAVVRDTQGNVLLIERTDKGLWAVPGGAQDIGESVADAVNREVREETGLEVEVTGISGIFSDPAHVTGSPQSGQ